MSIFRLNFYKDLKAFEIYKCLNGEGSDGVPDCSESIYDTGFKKWDFFWNDNLIINWTTADINSDQPLDHYLRFRRLSLIDDEADARKNPFNIVPFYLYGSDCIRVENGQQIKFIEVKHKEAEWAFDFCWGLNGIQYGSIDPEGKVKHPG